MDTLTKYLSIGLIGLSLVLVIFCLYFRSERDSALNKLNNANQQVNDLINKNLGLTTAKKELEKDHEIKQNYIISLEKDKAEVSKQANEQIKLFRRQQYENQSISTWANKSLPNGLY